MIDGRHTGTGGGNHVVVGGATPADSPFLRRPDLLAIAGHLLAAPPVALATCSPACSSARPARRRASTRRATTALRAGDRARADARSRPAATCPPWLVDRLFRNLLVDVTGNTHRAEICIDKLYSPDGPTGRLGLVEFRAFEMPPHARMSLAQQLLLRALIAWFWERALPPAAGPLGHRRCTTASCCRTMSGADFLDVLRRPARRTASPMQAGLVRGPVRVPLPASAARSTYRGVDARAAPGARALARHGRGGRDRRHRALRRQLGRAPAGQGRRASSARPLRRHLQRPRPAAAADRRRAASAVAGVRFRAWQPPAACTRPSASTRRCVFDIFDSWTGRSIGGCTYHVAHPGGRNYETFPVNGSRPRPAASPASSRTATRRAR